MCRELAAKRLPSSDSERREATEHNTPHKEQHPTTATGGTTACIVGGHTQQKRFPVRKRPVAPRPGERKQKDPPDLHPTGQFV